MTGVDSPRDVNQSSGDEPRAEVMGRDGVQTSEEEAHSSAASAVPTTPPTNTTTSAGSSESSIDNLLARIKELEAENTLLRSQRDATLGVYIAHASNLYDNVRDFQEQLKRQLNETITDSISKIGRFRIDLKPWVEAAARSRKVDPQVILDAVSSKKRQFLACVLTFLLLPGCLALSACWLAASILIDKSRVMLAALMLYATYMYRDRRFERGSSAQLWLKRHAFWRALGSYFPCLLMKQNPDTVFDPNGLYMFGYHPHGIISVGCFVNFAADATGCSDMFPGIHICPATLESNFFIPIWRELLIRLGVISVSATSIRNVLRKGPGHAVLVVPGGAAEALDAQPGTHSLTLNKRQGFFRIALQHGASLVPIYSFGENDLYEQASNGEGTFLRLVQDRLLRHLGFAMPFFSGAGSTGAAVPMNPIPQRVPIITIVGDPIPVPLVPDPSEADVERIKLLYIQKLQDIFNQFADTYAPQRKSDLKIVK
jgi:2-acylglycerol O-acyltransferase 2